MSKYEIHLTVESGDLDRFRSACSEIWVKPILLDLFLKDGIAHHLETSSRFEGDDQTVYQHVLWLEAALESAGFKVIRRKVEAPPIHPRAPQRVGDPMPAGCYFETHMGVMVSRDRVDELHRIAKAHDARMSQNAFKATGAEWMTMMVTLRTDDPFEVFKAKRDRLLGILAENFNPTDNLTEFALFDTNRELDDAWINQ